MISKILVPTDGSKAAQKAARYAIDLAKQIKATIVILCVIDKGSFLSQTVPAGKAARHVTEPIEDYLREAVRRVRRGHKKNSAIKMRSPQRRLSRWDTRLRKF